MRMANSFSVLNYHCEKRDKSPFQGTRIETANWFSGKLTFFCLAVESGFKRRCSHHTVIYTCLTWKFS